ncbi:hypothetical protein SDC9_170621 [bioreactor metagenome]|uniref:Uncharacterized protein n=1 Tax=bioreactor metagenome TaxID=1076179 RepID=A0A645GHN1_9ZZZZ
MQLDMLSDPALHKANRPIPGVIESWFTDPHFGCVAKLSEPTLRGVEDDRQLVAPHLQFAELQTLFMTAA